MNNQFQDFSDQMIAKYKGFGQTFDSAPMVFPESEPAGEAGGTSIENHYIKNLYQIQHLTEENHLYRQNLQFITNILEKKLEQRVVPSVEKLVEKTIQEELPDVEHQVIREMTDRLHTLVKEGGVEQLSVLREQLQREVETRTKEVQRETEVRATETRRELEREVRSLEMKRELIREVRDAESSRDPQIIVNNRERETRTESNSIEKEHTTEVQKQEQLTKEQLTELQKLTTTTNVMKQEVLLRKIENIYNSSTQNHFYGNAGQMGVRNVMQMDEHTVVQPGEYMAAQPRLQMPQRTFDSLHLEYGGQELTPETMRAPEPGSVPSVSGLPSVIPGKPDTPEFLKQQERTLEQIRETIARQLRSLTQQTGSSIQSKPQLQNTTVLQHRAPSQNTIPLQNVDPSQNTVWLQNTEPSQKAARIQNVELSQDTTQLPHVTPSKESAISSRTETLELEVSETGTMDKTLTIPEYRSKSIFRVEDLKRRRQPAESFQETELLYSFEQTHDENWNEIWQELVKEFRNEENKKSPETRKQSVEQNRLTEWTAPGEAGVLTARSEAENQSKGSVFRAKQLAEQIFRQASETIQQQTGGNISIHPAALEYLEQVLDSESGQQPENSTVLRTIERILDTYRVQQEPVKAAARSVKPKTGIVQQILGEAGNVRMQSQTVSQTESVRIQQVPSATEAMMIQPIPGQSSAMMMQPISGQSSAMTPQAISLIQLSGSPVRGAMEQASMIYPEEVSPEEQAEQSRKIEKQIHEITQDIKEVKKSTVVHQEILTEQQKEVVREVIRQAPETVREKDVSTLIRRQVQREVETQVDASLGQMTNRVYRRIEEKLRTERGRRGLL